MLTLKGFVVSITFETNGYTFEISHQQGTGPHDNTISLSYQRPALRGSTNGGIGKPFTGEHLASEIRSTLRHDHLGEETLEAIVTDVVKAFVDLNEHTFTFQPNFIPKEDEEE